ncbi:hypothetical protein ACQEU5_18850 [Marinactinospora thermotolerans]|uniref:Uncharacterized protein n=1 Tax=Marinactinospora thermotolerans DSM 45154 TaxID=1122192 RepID=A0A1T4NC65_9ACTN|nr:hypothetical protein [Marinactinospora thermotolerans]SJZ76849.1 hypothetical protein SAMN02745673_01384 [Marinactinospora thermotolerans DSM 45154]
MSAVGAPRRSGFRFDPRAARVLRLFGVRPETAWVAVGGRALEVRFGPWRVRTPRRNITGVRLGGPYRWRRVIGARMSLLDGG